MNGATSLDQLGVGVRARIAAIDWAALDDGDASRLRHFGFDEGVAVESLHAGPFGRDPIAIRVGMGASHMWLDYAGESVSQYFDDVQHLALTFQF